MRKKTSHRKLEDSLSKAISEWLDSDEVVDFQLPWLGENIAKIMAVAAVAVLRGMNDGELYMLENDMLKED